MECIFWVPILPQESWKTLINVMLRAGYPKVLHCLEVNPSLPSVIIHRPQILAWSCFRKEAENPFPFVTSEWRFCFCGILPLTLVLTFWECWSLLHQACPVRHLHSMRKMALLHRNLLLHIWKVAEGLSLWKPKKSPPNSKLSIRQSWPKMYLLLSLLRMHFLP